MYLYIYIIQRFIHKPMVSDLALCLFFTTEVPAVWMVHSTVKKGEDINGDIHASNGICDE